MNKILILLLVFLVGGIAYWKFGMVKPQTGTEISQSSSATVVELKDFSFNPKTVTVKSGSKVTFVNKDLTGHSVTADDNSFDSGILNQSEDTTVVFDKAGTFGFHCTPHSNMKFTVVVE